MRMRARNLKLFSLLTAMLAVSPAFRLEAQQKVARNDQPVEKSEHPIVPGFERFFSDPKADLARGGRLLLGELNCASCHKTDATLAKSIARKQAPVLDGVGARVKLSYLRKFLADPHRVKPGTTMPDLFVGLPESEKKAQVEALVSFLATTGSVSDSMANLGAARRGETLFHQVGCVACHAPRRSGTQPLTTSVPLGNPTQKYSLASLTQFLRDPFKVRPSGRMPSLNLDDKQARDIANYFFKDVKLTPNVNYAYFEGNWQSVPDFSKIKPRATGKAPGFDLHVTRRTSNFGFRFQAFLHIRHEGEYTFHLGSDDGSKLWIDGNLIVNNDGIHPHQTRSGKVKLVAGAHPLVVDYIQGGGEWTLALEFEGPNVKRQSAAAAVTLTKQPPKQKPGQKKFVLQPELVKKGRKLFASVGCAACHQLRENDQTIQSELLDLLAQPLDQLKPGSGCLSASAAKGVPDFRLNQIQRKAISAALKLKSTAKQPLAANESIHDTLVRFNCYACHARNKVGGVERPRNERFQTTIKEMGDEGRIPPFLDGVGDKLTESWLKNVLSNGAKDRPYMLTKMPKFGMQNIGHLVEAFRKVDLKTMAKIPALDLPPHRIKSAGRRLAGDKALSCIKCHNFASHKATGIQSLDLTTLTQRLRRDWFYRYMLNPQAYRPGTRMPAAWPFGQATIRDLLDGDAGKQIQAVWVYLKDGNKAAIPSGLIRNPIVLKPEKEPIVYRNFVAGLSPRGIAVGYPEKLNLAFDAEKLCLTLIWHNDFIDASKHWYGRGSGFQVPLGDHVMALVTGVPFAALSSAKTSWPAQGPKESGYRFRGYRLDQARRPTFLYRFGDIEIEDFSKPIPGKREPELERTLTLVVPRADSKTSAVPANLWYRAAAGAKIETLDKGSYLVDGALRIHVKTNGAAKPLVRKTGNRFELLVQIAFDGNKSKVVQTYVW